MGGREDGGGGNGSSRMWRAVGLLGRDGGLGCSLRLCLCSLGIRMSSHIELYRLDMQGLEEEDGLKYVLKLFAAFSEFHFFARHIWYSSTVAFFSGTWTKKIRKPIFDSRCHS